MKTEIYRVCWGGHNFQDYNTSEYALKKSLDLLQMGYSVWIDKDITERQTFLTSDDLRVIFNTVREFDA